MNTFDALNLLALSGAVKPTGESNLRYVMRWYSKTFHTPLHEVYHLPVEDIWLAFFEERYHGMPREELQTYIDLALETPEERARRIDAEEAEIASERAFKEMTEKAAAAKPVELKVMPRPADLLSQIPALPETTLATPETPLEPDIEMTFVDPQEMEKLLEGGMGTQTKNNPMSFK